ncbi:hypothetical protein BgAZ_107480 [Babesia gibsoni]|uniref:RED-like N-terminal domain-containing protein n=1 Tax=Babesia gibsoni TaxID=33632 RepID=A0AAD8PGC8_BABGI|nr:hypothetical protein BgAZ_107480 [Babesia gibsoni]
MVVGDHAPSGRRKHDHHKGKPGQKHDFKKLRFGQERDDDEEPALDSNYRNRALERSKMSDDYYKRVEEEYRLLKTQTEEESRYMGGDEEHTHLVKGLDYVLLEKVRKSLAPRKFFHHTHLHNRHFHERLNNTYNLLRKGYSFRKNQATSRAFYNFSLCMEPETNDVPSIVIVNDGPNISSIQSGMMSSNLDPEIKKELAEALLWHQENRKKKKEDRLPFRPDKHDSGDESDDIFAGAGEYRSDELFPETVAKLDENEKYFAESEEEEETYMGAIQLKHLARRKAPAKTYDGYDECYPDADDADSDDGGVGSKKKSKATKGEWQKIEKIIAEKNTIPMEHFEQVANSKK